MFTPHAHASSALMNTYVYAVCFHRLTVFPRCVIAAVLHAMTRDMVDFVIVAIQQNFALLLICATTLLFYCLRRRRGANIPPLPPGPKPLPLLGNVFDVPRSMSAQEYGRLSDKYGM